MKALYSQNNIKSQDGKKSKKSVNDLDSDFLNYHKRKDIPHED